MISSYKIKTVNGKVYDQQIDLTLKQDVYEENGHDMNTDFVNSKYKEILINKGMIVIRDDNISEQYMVDIKYDSPFLKVHFELGGNSIFTPHTKDGIEVKINKNQYNFFYLPKVDGTMSFSSSRKKSLEIIISEDYLLSTFKKGYEKISGALGNALKEKIPFKLFEHSEEIPSYLQVIINEIINCSYREEIKEVYLESKVKEIFSYLLLILNEKESKPEIQLNELDQKHIIQITQILKGNLRKSPTIRELASLSGINETKLKRNFKLVTGKPIFSYLTDLRMEKAKSLLQNEKISISDIAFTVGYKNPQHFTTAFKRKFNYVPSEYKSSVLKL